MTLAAAKLLRTRGCPFGTGIQDVGGGGGTGMLASSDWLRGGDQTCWGAAELATTWSNAARMIA
jgi:hypothetical protein